VPAESGIEAEERAVKVWVASVRVDWQPAFIPVACLVGLFGLERMKRMKTRSQRSSLGLYCLATRKAKWKSWIDSDQVKGFYGPS
jgi:hypothetical protein